MKKFIPYFFAFLALASCSGSNYPRWFVNQVDTGDQSFLYGFGSGVSEHEAKKSAINDVSMQIKSNVSSDFSSKFSEDSRIGHYQWMNKQIDLKVADIGINNYKIVNLEQNRSGRFFIKIAVDKKKLIKEKEAEFYLADSKMRNSYSLFLSEIGSLKKIRFLVEALGNAEKAASISYVLLSLGKEMDISTIRSNISLYNAKIDQIRSGLNGFISGADNDININIAEFLTKSGINLTSNSKNAFNIKYSYNIRNGSVYSEHLSVIDISIDFIDNDGRIYDKKNITVKGLSLVSTDDAKINAAKEIPMALQKENLTVFDR